MEEDGGEAISSIAGEGVRLLASEDASGFATWTRASEEHPRGKTQRILHTGILPLRGGFVSLPPFHGDRNFD